VYTAALALLDKLTPLRDFSLVLSTTSPLLVYSKRYFGAEAQWG